jgi:hypothetical protein
MLTDITPEEILIDEIPLGALFAPDDVLFKDEFICYELTLGSEIITIVMF